MTRPGLPLRAISARRSWNASRSSVFGHALSSRAMLPRPDLTIDTSGTYCPIPVIESQKAMRRLDGGQVLLVIATDPGVETDMPDWCKSAHHELLALVREGSTFRIYVRKRRA